MSLNTASKTLDEVLKWVKRQFGDESGAQITNEDIIRWTNAGISEISTLAKPIQAISTATLVPGQHEYTLPIQSAIEILSVRVDGRPLEGMEFQVAETRILDSDPNWITEGTPKIWWRFADKLYLWPNPIEENALQLLYIRAAAPVASTTDVIELPDKYFEALLQFIMSKAWELDEDQSASAQARQAFNDRLGLQFEEDARSETKFYPSISVVEDY